MQLKTISTPIREITFDLRCPFSKSDELFQSKVICEIWFELVEIGGVNFHFRGREGGGGAKAHYDCSIQLMIFSSDEEL